MSSAAGNKNRYLALELPPSVRYELGGIAWNEIRKQIPTFQPMADSGLHMTVVYLGNLAQNLGPKNIKSGLVELDMIIQEFNKRPITTLEFAGYELFSEKQNLIVAKFNIGAADKLRVEKMKVICADKFGEDVDVKDFAPHITLGKIPGCNATNKPNIQDLDLPRMYERICVPVEEFELSGKIYLAPR